MRLNDAVVTKASTHVGGGDHLVLLSNPVREEQLVTADEAVEFGVLHVDDDIIVVEQSGSKTAFRRFIESMPVLGIFSWF